MKSFVLGTGGLRSALVMALARKEGEAEALFIDYGQQNLDQDRAAFLALCKYYQIGTHIEHLHAPQEWIPFKLSFFLSCALVQAQQCGCGIVYYGMSKDDLIAESSEKYLITFRLLARRASDVSDEEVPPIDAEAPLALLNTERIIYLGCDSGYLVPWELTYSCEQGGIVHCGRCAHCIRRRRGFLRATIRKDPAKYANRSDRS